MSDPTPPSDSRLIDCPDRAPDWATATTDVQKIIIGKPNGDEPLELGALPADLVERFPHLTHLYLWNCAGMTELPQLPKVLQCLDVRGAKDFKKLGNLPTALRTLVLEDCPQLGALPVPQIPGASPYELQDVSLKGCAALPEGDVHALLRLSPQLRRFDASKSPRLTKIRRWPALLERIDLNGCAGLVELSAPWPVGLRRLGLRAATALRSLVALPEVMDFLDLAETTSLTAFPELGGSRPRTVYLHGSAVPLAAEVFGENADSNVAPDLLPFLEAARKGTVADNEVKVILLGNGRCGKTSLARRLIKGAFDRHESSTHGVQLWTMDLPFVPLESDEGETAPLNIWDFAGQNLYHSTHRLFLERKAVFILCGTLHPRGSDPATDAEEEALLEEEEKVDRSLRYWWSQVQSLPPAPGMTGPPPVLLVRTKVDRDGENTSRGADAYWSREGIDEAGLPSIDVSAESGKGVDQLREALARAVATVLGDDARRLVPDSVAAVKNAIRVLKRENEKELAQAKEEKRQPNPPHPVLGYHTVIDHEDNARKPTPSLAALAREHCPAYPIDSLLRLLHRSGFVYHPIDQLPETIILDQRWAIDAIYALTQRGGRMRDRLLRSGGKVTATEMANMAWSPPAAWRESGTHVYTEAEQRLFLRFMLECGMCFELLNAEWANAGESVYGVPGYFRRRDDMIYDLPDLDDGPADSWQHIVVPNCGEWETQAVVSWLGTHWGRSAMLWRWGGKVKSARSSAWCRVDWRQHSEDDYAGDLGIWFSGEQDALFLIETLEGLLEAIGRESSDDALAKWGVDPAWLRKGRRWEDRGGPDRLVRRGRSRDQKVQLDDADTKAMMEGEIELVARKSTQPTKAQAVGVRVCFSYANGDDQQPLLGEVPIAVAKELNHRDDLEVFCYQVETEEERKISDLSKFMDLLATGDLVLVFWSARYFRSWACMTEMMHIYREILKKSTFEQQLLVWGYDGARLDETLGSACHHSVIECYWREKLNERDIGFQNLYPKDSQRCRNAKEMESAHDWYKFVSKEAEFNEFLHCLGGFRLMRSLDVPATKFQSATQTKVVLAQVGEYLEELVGGGSST